jgi:UDP-glucose 4-epimerase
VPELGEPIRIIDLAKFLVGQNEVPIVFTELRPGDKMAESLISSRESYQDVSGHSLRAVNSPTLSPDELSTSLNAVRVALQRQDLSSLLQAVQRMVPDYCPSPGLRTDSSLMVNA